MKQLVKKVVAFVFMLSCFLYTQESSGQKLEKNVPIIVQEAFNQKFPLKDPVWFSKYQGPYGKRLVYEARFMLDNRYTKAFYENEGMLIAFAATIEESELPSEVREYMNKNYPTLPIAESLIVTHVNNDIHYEVGVYIDNEFVVMSFTKNGQYLKTAKR